MRSLRASLVATVIAAIATALPATQASAASVTGPSTPPGTPGSHDSRVLAANDSGVLVGELGSQVMLWRGGRATTVSDRGGQVHGINAAGSFTGTRPMNETPTGEADFRATVWTSTGAATDIAPKNATYSVGRAIADDGTVALGYTTRAGDQRWALWRAGSLTPLKLDPNARFAAMNQKRQVAANAYRNGVWVATRCSATGSCAALPQLPGTISSEAYDINDSGVVVGSAEVRTGTNTIDTVAVVWRGGKATALPGLSATAGQRFSRAEHVNDAGLVGGRSGSLSEELQLTSEAVVWKNGSVVRLAPGVALGGDHHGITDINAAGEVVGALPTAGTENELKQRGFVWRDGSLTTLDASFPLSSASISGITPGGLIYGESYTSIRFDGGGFYSGRATTWRVRR